MPRTKHPGSTKHSGQSGWSRPVTTTPRAAARAGPGEQDVHAVGLAPARLDVDGVVAHRRHQHAHVAGDDAVADHRGAVGEAHPRRAEAGHRLDDAHRHRPAPHHLEPAGDDVVAGARRVVHEREAPVEVGRVGGVEVGIGHAGPAPVAARLRAERVPPPPPDRDGEQRRHDPEHGRPHADIIPPPGRAAGQLPAAVRAAARRRVQTNQPMATTIAAITTYWNHSMIGSTSSHCSRSR